jgi:hypothetical protein
MTLYRRCARARLLERLELCEYRLAIAQMRYAIGVPGATEQAVRDTMKERDRLRGELAEYDDQQEL